VSSEYPSKKVANRAIPNTVSYSEAIRMHRHVVSEEQANGSAICEIVCSSLRRGRDAHKVIGFQGTPIEQDKHRPEEIRAIRTRWLSLMQECIGSYRIVRRLQFAPSSP